MANNNNRTLYEILELFFCTTTKAREFANNNFKNVDAETIISFLEYAEDNRLEHESEHIINSIPTDDYFVNKFYPSYLQSLTEEDYKNNYKDILRRQIFDERYDELQNLKLILKNNYLNKENSPIQNSVTVNKKVGLMLKKLKNKDFISSIRKPLISKGFINDISEGKFRDCFVETLSNNFIQIVWIEKRIYTLKTFIAFLRDKKMIDESNDYWLATQNIFLDKKLNAIQKKKIQHNTFKPKKIPNRNTELLEILENALTKFNNK